MTKVYAARVKNRDVLINSSSGGAFSAIAEQFDYVACARYNYETNQQEFVLIQDKNDLYFAQGSVYVQSKPGHIFKDITYLAIKHPQSRFLFIGMGCQSEGFRKFVELKGLRDNFCIVDIICHGSPSPRLWREYARNLGDITHLSFKDKRNGWMNPTAVATVRDKETSIDSYIRIFYDRFALRPSCYECPYAKVERDVDMTIGDFWHIEDKIPDFFDPMGTSVFLIHSDKGNQLWDKIKESLDYRESNTEQCWQKNLESPTERPENREKFWTDFQKRGVKYIIKMYGQDSFERRLKNKIKSFCFKG